MIHSILSTVMAVGCGFFARRSQVRGRRIRALEDHIIQMETRGWALRKKEES